MEKMLMNSCKIVHKNTVNLIDNECVWKPNKKKKYEYGISNT